MKYILRALFLGLASVASAETVSLTPAKDATIYSDDVILGVALGNGKGQTLSVGNVDISTVRRALIAFDASNKVPVGSKVTGARLKLKLSQSVIGPFLGVFRVTAAWTEGPTDPNREELGDPAKERDVTWLFRSYSLIDQQRLAWKTPGGDFNPNQALFSGSGQIDTRANTLTVSSQALAADVQTLVDAPEAHFGWLLLGGETLSGSLQLYASGDDPTAENRPVLEIDYEKRADFQKFIDGYETLNTVAGAGLVSGSGNDWKYKMEGKSALSAELSRPATAREDYAGNIVIADTQAHAIRRVGADGMIRTIAGTNAAGFNGDGLGVECQLNLPNGLAVTPDGSVYILDVGNRRIRRLDPSGRLRTIVHDEELDGGRGLWVSATQDVIYYASGARLRRWTSAGLTTVADGFRRLSHIDVEYGGDSLLAADDGGVYRVVLESGTRTRLAGGGISYVGERPATNVRLDQPRGLASLANGGFFISEVDEGHVWYVDPERIIHRMIRGQGAGNVRGGEGETLKKIVESDAWKLSEPFSVTVGPTGKIVITTNDSGLIRVIKRSAAPSNPGIDQDRRGMKVTWKALAGRSYVIEGTENLLQWRLLGEVTTNGDTGNFVDGEFKAKPTRFYRVRLFP